MHQLTSETSVLIGIIKSLNPQAFSVFNCGDKGQEGVPALDTAFYSKFAVCCIAWPYLHSLVLAFCLVVCPDILFTVEMMSVLALYGMTFHLTAFYSQACGMLHDGNDNPCTTLIRRYARWFVLTVDLQLRYDSRKHSWTDGVLALFGTAFVLQKDITAQNAQSSMYLDQSLVANIEEEDFNHISSGSLSCDTLLCPCS